MLPTIEEIRATMQLHHTASRQGYVSRKSGGHVENYQGRYGAGYVIVTPRWDTTRYVNIEYYIVKEATS